MNHQTPALFLPILRKENMTAPFLAELLPIIKASCLWPGFENMPEGYWQPSNYPFTPKEAKACFDDLHAMSEAALFGMPIHTIIGAQDQGREAKNIEERNQLLHFSKTGDTTVNTNNIHVLQAAQKILLWASLLEERFFEINTLTQTYSEGMQGLVSALGAEQDEEFSDIEEIESRLDTSDALLPPWKIVFENAAVFLEDNCTIIVNHMDMAAQIYDVCENVLPLSDDTKQSLGLQEYPNIKECHAEIGHILNSSERQKESSPWLQKKLHFILLENI